MLATPVGPVQFRRLARVNTPVAKAALALQERSMEAGLTQNCQMRAAEAADPDQAPESLSPAYRAQRAEGDRKPSPR
jgi:hypothetical protein